MRDRSGVTGAFNDVTLKDLRRHNLRDLLWDLSRPGLCLILGAGASHGVVPMSIRDIAELAREILAANRNYSVLPPKYLDQMQHPEVTFITDILVRIDPEKWDRVLEEFRNPGQASFILNEVFRPRNPVPVALLKIYDVLENERGVIVSYNYDRIVTDGQTRFRVITPHGQRSDLLANPKTFATGRKLALGLGVPLEND